MPQPLETIIRAIPDRLTGGWMPLGEQWFTTKGLSYEQQQELREELRHRGYLVQDIWLQDGTPILVERRVRKELEHEAEEREHQKAQQQ